MSTRKSTIGRTTGVYDRLLRVFAYSGNCARQVAKYNGKDSSYNSKIVKFACEDGFIEVKKRMEKMRSSYQLTKEGYDYVAEQIAENGIEDVEVRKYFRLPRSQSNVNEHRRNVSLSQIASLMQNIGAALYPDEEGFYGYQEECKRQGIIVKPQGRCFIRADILKNSCEEVSDDRNAMIGTRAMGVLITPMFNMEVYFFDKQQLKASKVAEDRFHARATEFLACTGNPIYALYVFSDKKILQAFMQKTSSSLGSLDRYNCRCDRLYAHMLLQSKADPDYLIALIEKIEERMVAEKKEREQQELTGKPVVVPYHDMTALDIAYLNRLNTHYAETKNPVKIQTLPAYAELVDKYCREYIGNKLTVTTPSFCDDN